jgi:hypothetical protein
MAKTCGRWPRSRKGREEWAASSCRGCESYLNSTLIELWLISLWPFEMHLSVPLKLQVGGLEKGSVAVPAHDGTARGTVSTGSTSTKQVGAGAAQEHIQKRKFLMSFFVSYIGLLYDEGKAEVLIRHSGLCHGGQVLLRPVLY